MEKTCEKTTEMGRNTRRKSSLLLSIRRWAKTAGLRDI